MARRDPWRVLKSNTKRRAKRRGIPYTLSDDDWTRLRERSNGRCELTGVEFDWGRDDEDKGKIRPLAASLDRVDSSKGYYYENVRLTIFAVNCAMSSWGEDFLYSWARSFVSRYEDTREEIKCVPERTLRQETPYGECKEGDTYEAPGMVEAS